MNFTNNDFQLTEMKRDVSSMQSISVDEGEALYKYLNSYIANNLVEGQPNLSLKLLPAKVHDIDFC